jgi:hypothetical protein
MRSALRSGQYCLYYSNPLANHEIEHINGDRYIPSGIRPITQGGHLIQEGSDTIDINTETVDGKNDTGFEFVKLICTPW